MFKFSEFMEDFISNSFLHDVNIDFDSNENEFCLSMPIFSSPTNLPANVFTYVEARKNVAFKPYKTYFALKTPGTVHLVQILPFLWGYQPTFREQILAFRKMAESMHQMLLELAIEEKLHHAQDLFLDEIFHQEL